jgi:hypothetical protein
MLPIASDAIEAPSLETAAALDIVTTAIGLSNGARELNPLGFGGTTAVKLILIPYVNSIEDEAQRKETQNFLSSILTGASVNNVLAIFGVSPVISLTSGYMMYKHLRKGKENVPIQSESAKGS